MFSKKINKNGSITLPKQVRSEVGIFAGNSVDIEMSDDSIRIRKHINTCRFCGSTENVKSVMGIDICTDCAAKIHKAVVCDG